MHLAACCFFTHLTALIHKKNAFPKYFNSCILFLLHTRARDFTENCEWADFTENYEWAYFTENYEWAYFHKEYKLKIAISKGVLFSYILTTLVYSKYQ